MDNSQEVIKQKKKLLELQPSAFLLAAQLLQLLLFTIFHQRMDQHSLIGAVGVTLVVAVLWVIDQTSALAWVKWALFMPALLLSLASTIFHTNAITAWSSLANAVFYFFAVASMIKYMMGDFRVTTDEIFAIVATYTLITWAFAYLYMACQVWVPGSFVSSIVGERALVFNEALFISFTNLSSTGLSDISPASTWARSIMMLEQMSGGIYIAVVVSRLVGMSLSKRKKSHEFNGE
jgi:hypothetical protein